MNTLKTFTRYIVIATILSLLMGYEWWSISPTVNKLTHNLPVKIKAVFEDPELQPWIETAFLAYIATFISIRLSNLSEPQARWRLYFLAAAQGLVGLGYFTESGPYGANTTDALIFSGACAVGLGFSFWMSISNATFDNFLKQLLLSFIILFCLASLHKGDPSFIYRYKDAIRTTGIWKNPNIFGLLTGCGLSMIISLNIMLRQEQIDVTKRSNVSILKKNGHLLLLLPAALLFFGLIESLSRAAFLGTILSIFWLYPPSKSGKTSINSNQGLFSRLKGCIHTNRASTTILSLAVSLLIFWSFRHTGYTYVRRIFTIGNTLDHSWINRLLTSEESLTMLYRPTMLGYGCGEWRQIYENYFQAIAGYESGAITLNCFLELGITNGLLTVLLFVSYLSYTFYIQKRNLQSSLQFPRKEVILMPSVTILLIGFLLDGGLFYPETSFAMWILIELQHRVKETNYHSHTISKLCQI